MTTGGGTCTNVPPLATPLYQKANCSSKFDSPMTLKVRHMIPMTNVLAKFQDD